MATEQVRMWRLADEDRVLLMAGQTTHYAIEPRGEYVFGVVTRQPMRSRRGRERRVVLPGQLVAWDPSGAHAGTAVDAQPWTARLMVVEVADLAALAGDEEVSVLADVAFSEPVISDRRLAGDFLALHNALDGTADAQAQRPAGLACRAGPVRVRVVMTRRGCSPCAAGSGWWRKAARSDSWPR